MAQMTENFSGADLTELCQRACKAAVRESIASDEDQRNLIALEKGIPKEEVDKEDIQDQVAVVTRQHFEEAFSSARQSVNKDTLAYFEDFRKK